jgi:hypothetical protein
LCPDGPERNEILARAFIDKMGEPAEMGYFDTDTIFLLFPHQNMPDELKDIAERMTSQSLLTYLGDEISRATIYCRVSTDNQEREGTSLQTQQENCLKYCQGNIEMVQIGVSEGYDLPTARIGTLSVKHTVNEIRKLARIWQESFAD